MTDLLSHTEAGVLTLTFNRPDKKNSITQPMYAALADALEAARGDSQVRVVVIEGHELVFTAGNDLADFTPSTPVGPNSPLGRFLHGICDFPKPVIAAVCGAAVGIGTTMLVHCDLVYAGDNATFSTPFVTLGLLPEAASTLLMPALIGPKRASEAFLLGESFVARTAQDIGLVNRVLPHSEVNVFARQQALKLAAKPLKSLIETKRLMKMAEADAVSVRIDAELEMFRVMTGEPAAKEAVSAFREKRKPDFSKL